MVFPIRFFLVHRNNPEEIRRLRAVYSLDARLERLKDIFRPRR